MKDKRSQDLKGEGGSQGGPVQIGELAVIEVPQWMRMTSTTRSLRTRHSLVFASLHQTKKANAAGLHRLVGDSQAIDMFIASSWRL